MKKDSKRKINKAFTEIHFFNSQVIFFVHVIYKTN